MNKRTAILVAVLLLMGLLACGCRNTQSSHVNSTAPTTQSTAASTGDGETVSTPAQMDPEQGTSANTTAATQGPTERPTVATGGEGSSTGTTTTPATTQAPATETQKPATQAGTVPTAGSTTVPSETTQPTTTQTDAGDGEMTDNPGGIIF